MAKKRKPQPIDPYVQQAEQYAVLRFGPQASGLRTLLQNARLEYQRSVKNAREGAQAVQEAVTQSAPLVDQAYQDAAARMQQAQGIVDQGLAGIGQPQGASAAIQQAIQFERQGAAENLAREQAFSQQALQRRATDAVVGSRAAITEAKNARNTAVGQILQQASDLAGQRGAFISSTAQDLAGSAASAQAKADAQAADRALRKYTVELQAKTSLANSKRSARTSRQNAAARAEAQAIRDGQAADDKYLTKFGKTRDQFLALPEAERERLIQSSSSSGGTTEKTPSGVKIATPTQFGGFKDNIDKTLRQAKFYMGSAGWNRQQAAEALLNGVPARKDKNGKVVREAIKPATSSPLAAKVALDLAYNGRVSRGTRQELWQRGYTLDRLGYQGPLNKPKSVPEGRRRVVASAGAGLASIDKLLRQLG